MNTDAVSQVLPTKEMLVSAVAHAKSAGFARKAGHLRFTLRTGDHAVVNRRSKVLGCGGPRHSTSRGEQSTDVLALPSLQSPGRF